jgi:aryl-phospho-beta-D-glucosidase BglC (GH1 family)
MQNFLRTSKQKILDGEGNPVILKGANFGGWLMMEAYILGAPNNAEQIFKKNFQKVLGGQQLKLFEDEFRKTFIQEKDFKNIADIGFNCLRIPFNCRLVEKEAESFVYDKYGIKMLDQVLEWAAKYNLKIILDLHAAPGAQNHDWHADSLGKAEFWTSEPIQRRVYGLWQHLADRYKDNPTVAGYDLLNESVIDDPKKLNKFYKELIKSIRSVDKKHILFIEGNKWATDINCLDPIEDDNYCLSIHTYEPLAFTFNFVPHLAYPINSGDRVCNHETLRKHLMQYKETSDRCQVPIYVGEFGVNYREGKYGEDRWLADNLSLFNEFGFHWTYWTYKSIKMDGFPDGIYSYYENPAWVARQGPVKGWDTYHLHWNEHKKDMIASLDTAQFRENTAVLNTLKKYL